MGPEIVEMVFILDIKDKGEARVTCDAAILDEEKARRKMIAFAGQKGLVVEAVRRIDNWSSMAFILTLKDTDEEVHIACNAVSDEEARRGVISLAQEKGFVVKTVRRVAGSDTTFDTDDFGELA